MWSSCRSSFINPLPVYVEKIAGRPETRNREENVILTDRRASPRSGLLGRYFSFLVTF
jgi:hypothetical protein